MKKLLIVSIFSQENRRFSIHTLLAPIRCSIEEEMGIKHNLESQRNDPNVILDILRANVPSYELALKEKDLEMIKKAIETSITLTAEFFMVEDLFPKIKFEQIVHNYCPS